MAVDVGGHEPLPVERGGVPASLDGEGHKLWAEDRELTLARESVLPRIRTSRHAAAETDVQQSFSFTPAEANSKVMFELMLGHTKEASMQEGAARWEVKPPASVSRTLISVTGVEFARLSGTQLVELVIEELEREEKQKADAAAAAEGVDALRLPSQGLAVQRA
jgi:hypothetical protein